MDEWDEGKDKASLPDGFAFLPPRTPLDRARFTAGVVRFYGAILKKPIPEKMLRLIDEIEKQERGS